MKNWIGSLIISMVQTTATYGAPALFKDAVLTIDESIAVVDGEAHLYRNIRLAITPTGDFQVVDGEVSRLVEVNELAVAVFFTEPAEVELDVKGFKSMPCVDVKASVVRKDDVYYVAVSETGPDPLVLCAQVMTPFELTMPLDVTGLSLGNYRVVVNDQEIDFDLE